MLLLCHIIYSLLSWLQSLALVWHQSGFASRGWVADGLTSVISSVSLALPLGILSFCGTVLHGLFEEDDIDVLADLLASSQ